MSEKKESKLLRFAYYAVPFLLVVYILSIGPALALLLDSYGTWEYPEYLSRYQTFYAPLIWCANKNEFINDLIREYVIICNGPDTVI